MHGRDVKMSEILRKDNETKFAYVKRLTENRRAYDLDYSEWVKLICDYECSSENGRKAHYVISRLLDELEEEMVAEVVGNSDSLTIQELVDELEGKKVELQKERYKLQDQRRQYHSLVRTEARWEVLVDSIKDEIAKLPALNWHSHRHYLTFSGNEASLLLSDWHIGTEIDTPHNTFNLKVAQERIDKLKHDTIKHCKLNSVETLHVNIAGDMISGVIHVTTRILNQENVVSQVMTCSELLSRLINDLAIEIPSVNINYTIGNHGRVSANVKESLDSENFEYLILEFLKLRLKDTKNIRFNESKVDKEIVTYKVFGETIALVHGHREKKPFDSTKELSAFLGEKVDTVMMGHFHNFAVRNNVVVNGCLSGSDEYANNLRFNNAPSQVLMIHFRDGNKALYEIILK